MSTSCLSERLLMSKLMQDDINETEEVAAKPSSSELELSYKKEVSPYQQEIRPLLDVVDRLRNLHITNEGIELPSIVVVGDQSSGKSSVLESLAGINLPRGQGICTRVPLFLQLKSCTDESQASISIQYPGKNERIQGYETADKIRYATDTIAGEGSGISNIPITLEVVRVGAPDLTMVDLPGITRVSIPGQPPDIYEQITEIIMQYLIPKESIILNVISADVDFSTCDSIRMSKIVDGRGERTLAVVTKCDRAPEGLLEKVTLNEVNIRLGYVCVRNRVGNETNEEARAKEKALFIAHPKLKNIDKSMVGIPVLAKKLMQIQARSINESVPTVIINIDSMLSERQAELSELPQHLCNPQEADIVFVKLLDSMKECLHKIVMEGNFKQFQDDRRMHCTARMREMFEGYYTYLCNTGSMSVKFLAKETEMLEKAKGVGLPNFLSRPVFLNLLQMLVDQITQRSLELVFMVWEYMENVILQVIDFYCQCYPHLQADVRGVIQDLILKKKKKCEKHVKERIQMEKLVDFTLNPLYMETYCKLLTSKVQFMERLRNLVRDAENPSYGNRGGYDVGNKSLVIDGIGEVDVSEIMDISTERIEEAYDMQMSVMAYWKVVTLRMGDEIPLYLQFVCRTLVMSEFNVAILAQVGRTKFGAMEQLLVESHVVANKRRSLTRSIDLLRESKAAVASIIGQIAKA